MVSLRMLPCNLVVAGNLYCLVNDIKTKSTWKVYNTVKPNYLGEAIRKDERMRGTVIFRSSEKSSGEVISWQDGRYYG